MISLLNERQTRLYVAEKALEMGRGGVTMLARVSGLSERTIRRGIQELQSGVMPAEEHRVRRTGAGRKRAEAADTRLLQDLQHILEDTTRGESRRLLCWSCKSLETLADDLAQHGHAVSPNTVDRLLGELGYCRRTAPRQGPGLTPDQCGAQYQAVQAAARSALQAGVPVLDLAVAKRALPPRQSGARRQPRTVSDVLDHVPRSGSALDSPLTPVTGTGDTAELAADCLARWWRWVGLPLFPAARQLLVLTGLYRQRCWRERWVERLRQVAAHNGLSIGVAHYPPGLHRWDDVASQFSARVTMRWGDELHARFEVDLGLVGTSAARPLARSRLRRSDYAIDGPPPSVVGQELVFTPQPECPQWNYRLEWVTRDTSDTAG